MRETGERFVCDRCGKELFKPNSSEPCESRSFDELLEERYPSDWGEHLYFDGVNNLRSNHLCQDCYGTYNVMIADFMALREIKVVE